MAEYIKREAIMKFPIRKDHCDKKHANEHFIFGIESVLEYVENLPAADVAPVRHGKWAHSRYENCSEQFEIVKCSCCGHEAYAMAFYVRGGNFCPNCGARMDGGDSDDANGNG